MTRCGEKVPWVVGAFFTLTGCGGGPLVSVKAVDREGWVYRLQLEGRSSRPINEVFTQAARSVCSLFQIVDIGDDMRTEMGAGGMYVAGPPRTEYLPYVDIRCVTEPKQR
jgi:hypothetical protein